MNAELARPGPEQVSFHADDIAQVQLLVKREVLLAHRVLTNINLQPLAVLQQMRESGLAHAAYRCDARAAAADEEVWGLTALLHDFGKVAVPEYIFGKAKKLPDGRLETVRLRFFLALEQAASESERTELLALLEQIVLANEPRVVDEAADATLTAAATRTYRELDTTQPLLSAEELEFLRIPRGSLSGDERRRMEMHVTQSFAFLREIPWTKTPWQNVAELAYGHHELLDGTGYPRGLRADAISPQIRMLTISDVFDALTASDRPYKPAMPVERALDILTREFAERGKVDRGLLDLFISKRLYLAPV